jgi:spore photoproduct lyase
VAVKKSNIQADLFGENPCRYYLPTDYEPVRPDFFQVSRIYLAKGSVSTPERRTFVERICTLYPEVEIIECFSVPHNRIELNETNPLALHKSGKKTLVFGELKSAVRFSQEEGNSCPNYWHFSPYGFCPYGCKYCYLAGTQGVKFSPTVKIYVNLPEMLDEINGIALKLGRPTAFYLGKLQDALALDPLTAYSTVLVPFFAEHPYARFTLLTKSTNINRILELEHKEHTILSWSLNPPEISRLFEENVPGIEERLEAMIKSATAGYPVRAVIMPIIPIQRWQEIYTNFVRHLIDTIPLQRLTLGGICSYKAARALMETKLGLNNTISINLENAESPDGRNRYFASLRAEMYKNIIKVAQELRPDLKIALCLEDEKLWKSCGLESNIGRCNCVL